MHKLSLILLLGGAYALSGCSGSTDDKSDSGDSGTGDSGDSGTGDSGGGDSGDSGGGDSGDSGGGDSGDSGGGNETGFGFYFYASEVNTPGGTFSDGYWGFTVFGLVESDFVCYATSALDETTTPPGEACDGCDFKFGVSTGTNATTYEGPYCDGTGLSSVDWTDFSFGIAWGPETYDYTFSSGNTYTFEYPTFLYYGGEWFLFSYGYGGNGYSYTSPDGAGFIRPYITGSGGNYYWLYGYYYRY